MNSRANGKCTSCVRVCVFVCVRAHARWGETAFVVFWLNTSCRLHRGSTESSVSVSLETVHHFFDAGPIDVDSDATHTACEADSRRAEKACPHCGTHLLSWSPGAFLPLGKMMTNSPTILAVTLNGTSCGAFVVKLLQRGGRSRVAIAVCRP